MGWRNNKEKESGRVKQFLADRKEALLSLNADVIKAYMGKYGISIPPPYVFWFAVHKARTADLQLPIESRRESKKWLIEHGSQSLDDGEL